MGKESSGFAYLCAEVRYLGSNILLFAYLG